LIGELPFHFLPTFNNCFWPATVLSKPRFNNHNLPIFLANWSV
jgi:hypothetical protein